MKRTAVRRFLLALTACLVAACATQSAPPTAEPQPTLTPFITLTPIDTPVNTATPTLYPTSTIVKIPTWDPFLPTDTPQPLDFGNGIIIATATSAKPGAGFASVSYAPNNNVFWGGCKPNSVRIVVEVDDPEDVASVVYFLRVKDFEKDDYTPWDNGNVMFNRGNGKFVVTIYGSDIYGHNHYKHSWVYFQLVAIDFNGEEVGRTRIYEKAFDMRPCPCLTPLTGCPINTPKR